MQASLVVTKSCCHLITVCWAVWNNGSLQRVPSVNVKKTNPMLGTNDCPRWQPKRGGQGLTVVSPFSACSGPAESVCGWFVVKRCVLCSLQGCQPGIFHKCWFLSLGKQGPSLSSHSTFRSPASWFFFFFYVNADLKKNQETHQTSRTKQKQWQVRICCAGQDEAGKNWLFLKKKGFLFFFPSN